MSHEIVPTKFALAALRDSGYKTIAHALAELIDNAVEANASHIDLMCMERKTYGPIRQGKQVHKIGVLDNGTGMNAQTLRLALQYGRGTHLDPNQRKGMGRFGAGLLASSLSQAKRVDVWSWQDGIESAYHTYVDLDAVVENNVTEVPEPCLKSLPFEFQNAGHRPLGSKGTLVVWSNIDRYSSKQSSTLYNSSFAYIGRIYRRQLASNITLRFVTVNGERGTEGETGGWHSEKYFVPNDPLYLTRNTSFEGRWGAEPVFEERTYDDPFMHRIPVYLYKGENRGEHFVTLRFSRAKADARVLARGDAGHLDYGKHAAKNQGVSLMRADRELDLDQGLVSKHTIATERWWGVEVDFPPALDDVFGVTNNKQEATHFSALAKSDLLDNLRDLEAVRQKCAETYDYEDERGALLEIVYWIKQGIGRMRKELDKQTEDTRSESRGGFTVPKSAVLGSRPTAQTGRSETREGRGERSNDPIKQPVARTFPSFTDTDQPMPKTWSEVRAIGFDALTETELRDRLSQATCMIECMTQAWTRLEDKTPEENRQWLHTVRAQWDEIVRQFLVDG